jgi:hypothetical protein
MVETKRLWFNIEVGISGISAIVSTGNFECILFNIFGIVAWGLIVNILISTGILVEILDDYYFKSKFKLSRFRWFFYIAGTILYCILTFGYAIFYFIDFADF